jgi:chromosome segregation ATPase
MSESTYIELLAEFRTRERISDRDFVNIVNTGVQNEPDKQFRDKRNSELHKTDKYAAVDFPFPNEEKRKEWLRYRQDLRDLPGKTKNIKKVVWPEEPNMSDSEHVYKYNEDVDNYLKTLHRQSEATKMNYEHLKSVLHSTHTQLQTTQTDLQTTQTDLQTIQTDLQTAQTDLQTAQTDLQTAQTDLQTAQTDLQTIQTDLQTTQTDLQTAQTDLQTAQTDLQTTQGELDQTRLELEATKVKVRDMDARLGIVEQSLASILSNLNV